MKFKNLLLIAILSLSSLAMNAQSQDSLVIQLSLSEAQEYALEHNRSLKSASLDVLKAEATRWKSISSLLPQLEASADYANMFGYSIDLGPSSINMPSTIDIGATAAVAFSGAQIIGVNISKLAESMSDINLKKTEQDITNQVKMLYYSANLTAQTIELLERNLENIESLYNFSQKSVDVGVSEQIDADQILVQKATVETTISSTKRTLEMAYNSLRLLLNIGVDTEIVLTQSLDQIQTIEDSFSLVEEEFRLEDNFDYQLMEKNTELSKKQVDIAKMAYVPSLTFFYQYNYRTQLGSEGGFNMTPPNMIGAGLKIPIFSSGSRKMAVKEAKYDYEKQLNQLMDTEDAMLVQHRQLIYNLTSAYERYQTQQKNVEVTQRVFDNISKKYEYGTASSLDVTNSGTNLITAQNNYVQAVLEFVNAQIELEKLMNK